MAVKTLTSEQVKKCFSPPSLLKPIKPMMKELKTVLDKVNMTWFLDGGSILGALRHSSV